jgi:hypothetical protein
MKNQNIFTKRGGETGRKFPHELWEGGGLAALGLGFQILGGIIL